MERKGLGVVAAMPQEIAPFLRRVRGYHREQVAGFNLYRFPLNGKPVFLIESGMGPAHAAAATAALIEKAAPGVIVNFGFGGAVLPGLEVEELVLADRVYQLDGEGLNEVPAPDAALGALALESCRKVGLNLRRGSFITASGIVSKMAMAGALGTEIALPVLEMETAAVLRTASAAGIPVVALRGVSDAADEELGFAIEEFCDEDLNLSPWRILRALLRRPGLVPQLVRLSGNSKRAGRNVALAAELSLQALARRP